MHPTGYRIDVNLAQAGWTLVGRWQCPAAVPCGGVLIDGGPQLESSHPKFSGDN